jgi:superfamily II DNA or RNA helicase
MKLLPHQIKFASGYSDYGLLAHEGGTGKTVCACAWLKDGRDRNALIVCPKRVVKKWEKALEDWGTKGTVISKERFKKLMKEDPEYILKPWSARVIDEADEFASPLFTKGRSQLTTDMYRFVKEYDMPTLLLTATPIRSTPWNLHTLLTFIGKYVKWQKWREVFFVLESRPFIKWMAWFPKKEWRTRIRISLEKHADIVLLKDCVGYLPPVRTKIITLPKRKFITDELQPSKRFSLEHQFEQEKKIDTILEIGKNFKKVLVVAYYREQIETLYKELSKDRKTFMVYGSTKNQEDVLQEANDLDDECFLIVQAGIGAGFDADSFSCVIFASMSYMVRDYVQMKFRVRRIHNLHPVIYYHIFGGRCDKAVYETVQLGRDFVPSEYGYDD